MSVFSANLAFAGPKSKPKGWTSLRIECTNDDNVACLKWTKRSVDLDGCTYVQIDLTKEAKKNIIILVNVSDGNRVIMTQEVIVEKGNDTSYAKEIYLGKANEGQTMYFTIENIRCK